MKEQEIFVLPPHSVQEKAEKSIKKTCQKLIVAVNDGIFHSECGGDTEKYNSEKIPMEFEDKLAQNTIELFYRVCTEHELNGKPLICTFKDLEKYGFSDERSIGIDFLCEKCKKWLKVEMFEPYDFTVIQVNPKLIHLGTGEWNI